MFTSAHDESPLRAATWLNLLLPGGGLILGGALWSGIVAGVLFAGLANLAIAMVLLLPDDFSRTAQVLTIVLAAGSYVWAQVRMAQTVRGHQARSAAALRRHALAEASDLLARGDYTRALEMVAPLAEQNPDDLFIAYRVAQVLTALGHAAARDAWARVRALDPHGIYRPQVRAHLDAPGRVPEPRGASDAAGTPPIDARAPDGR